MEHNLNGIIKDALIQEANEYTGLKDIFQSIRQEAVKNKKKLNNSFPSFSSRKIILSALGCIFITFVLLFTFSGNVRSLAADTIERIFILVQADGETNIVEKPVDEIDFTYTCSNRTFLSEKELEQKLGYPVHFPETLYGDYTLEYKNLNITLGQKIKRSVYQEKNMEMTMSNALEDDTELEKLLEYDAYRSISASYKKQNGSRISVYIEPMPEAYSVDEIDKYYRVEAVKIDNLNGRWVKYKYPEYEEKIKNNAVIIDRSKPPVRIMDANSLMWETEDAVYHLEAYKNHSISKMEAVKIAESFLNKQ